MAYVPFGGTTDGNSSEAGSSDNPGNNGAVAHFLGGSDNGSSGSGERDARGDEFDPAIHIDRDKRNADGSFRKKRGRKSATAAPRSRTKADNQASVEGLTRILAIFHVGIAAATKTPEMVLQDAEASNLAAATANVLEEFDIRPDPKIEAVIGLVTAASMIYGPRIYLITERKKREAVERAQKKNEEVVYQ
jgi:hypothetical protein